MGKYAARVSSDSSTGAGGGGLRWPWYALLTIAAVLLLGFAFAADVPVREFVEKEATPAQLDLAASVTKYTKSPWFFGTCALGWIASRLLRRREWQRRWLLILAATVLAGAAVNIPRSFTGRARPKNTEAQGWFGVRHNGEWIIVRYKYNSFPSGHATTAAAFAFATLLCFRRLGWLAVLAAAATGWARIWESAHHFSDVAVGMAFGGVLAWCIWRWYLERGWLATDGPPAAAPCC